MEQPRRLDIERTGRQDRLGLSSSSTQFLFITTIGLPFSNLHFNLVISTTMPHWTPLHYTERFDAQSERFLGVEISKARDMLDRMALKPEETVMGYIPRRNELKEGWSRDTLDMVFFDGTTGYTSNTYTFCQFKVVDSEPTRLPTLRMVVHDIKQTANSCGLTPLSVQDRSHGLSRRHIIQRWLLSQRDPEATSEFAKPNWILGWLHQHEAKRVFSHCPDLAEAMLSLLEREQASDKPNVPQSGSGLSQESSEAGPSVFPGSLDGPPPSYDAAMSEGK